MNETLMSLGQSREPCKDESLCGSDSSVRGNLLRTKTRIEEQLSKVNAGLQVLETEPKFSANIETLLKAMRV